MKIGIQHIMGSFSEQWIEYCKVNSIDFKIVNCYKPDIIQQLDDCDALMWHFSQNSSRDFLFAKQLILAVEALGKKVFPSSKTSWHFDDKVGQKYLLEASSAPLPKTWVFYNDKDARQWAESVKFPVVFKLRGGAGSQNVRLVNSKSHANKLIRKAFNKGFASYDAFGSLKERWRLYKLTKTTLLDVVEGLARFVIPPKYARFQGRHRGYIYFQEFIPDNDHDIRVIVIGNKAFAIQRMVRENDFRASGSGNILYDKDLFNIRTISLSFDLARKIESQCIALDFVYKNNDPILVEISYGFVLDFYLQCDGYWTDDLEWHNATVDPCGWMVEELIKEIPRSTLKSIKSPVL